VFADARIMLVACGTALMVTGC